jgi:hypothetical protein
MVKKLRKQNAADFTGAAVIGAPADRSWSVG